MLFLVRHGRTAHNAERRLLGRADPPLDEVGRRQAAALARVEVLAKASKVISSPLLRARQTAEAIGPPVALDPAWAEVDFGELDESPLEDSGALWARWQEDLAYSPPGGESLAALGGRVRQALEALWEQAIEADVVVVSHVSPLKAAVAWTLGVGDEICWRMFLDLASLSRVGPSGSGAPLLLSYNETHHLLS